MLIMAFLTTVMAAAQCFAESDFILIRGGTFLMGSPSSEAGREKDETRHRVTVGDFTMGKYEVTQREYREMMGANPSQFKGDDLPVENVTWFEAVRYCNARSVREGLTPAYSIRGQTVSRNRNATGYRLPTEAEWEYACRAGTTDPFSTGANITTDQANYYGTYPYENLPRGEYRQKTVPVRSFEPNPWGLYNVHGNVWEWCWDRYGNYGNGDQTDPAGPSSGAYRVYRGGGWNDFGRHLRSAYRAASPPANRAGNLGFRLVRSVR
jgi:formylglycine-generating enzyme required for sulfatase activity